MVLRLKRSLIFIAGALVALLMALTARQAFSNDAASHPGNRRTLIEELTVERGDIYAADGTVLATSRLDKGVYKRGYPQGPAFAAVTGYYSPVRGRSGLEAGQNDWLAARRHFSSWQDWYRSLANKHRRGFDVTLSVKPAVQLRAWQLLAGGRGAVVALDPASGAILAFVSRPAYDPNLIDSRWREIAATEGLLVNRASQGLYAPGSTFKIITTAGALDYRTASPSKVYDGPAVLKVYGSQVTNFADQDQGRMSLSSAFAKSTNTIFAQVGLDLGPDRLVETAEGFGFNSRPPIELPAARSQMPPAVSMDKVMTACTAVGQGRTLATPLEMALSAAAVAEGGRIMQPHLTDSVRDFEGGLRWRQRPRLWLRATTPSTAAKLKKMMVAAVKSGTGRGAALEGTVVAGKTGTAEVGGGKSPHAWFVGFAPADNPRVAVAVMLENGGLGGTAAAPIAREIIRTALEH